MNKPVTKRHRLYDSTWYRLGKFTSHGKQERGYQGLKGKSVRNGCFMGTEFLVGLMKSSGNQNGDGCTRWECI